MNNNQTGFPADNNNFMDVFNQVVRMVVRRYKHPWWIAQEVAMKAVEYSLPALCDPSRPKPATIADLVRLVTANAKHRAVDEGLRIKRSPVKGSIDEVENCDPDGDGSGHGEHPALTRASMEVWRAARADAEMREKAQICWKLLPAICKKARISVRDREVYCKYMLERVPVNEVSEKYKITANNIYRICSSVGKQLAKYGPAIVEAAFSA